jgi:hypothetical protein
LWKQGRRMQLEPRKNNGPHAFASPHPRAVDVGKCRIRPARLPVPKQEDGSHRVTVPAATAGVQRPPWQGRYQQTMDLRARASTTKQWCGVSVQAGAELRRISVVRPDAR